MSDNKFIKHLRGENTAKSVLEIKNQRTTTSFANMSDGDTSNANDVYSDHRGNATGVLKGTENWKLNGSTLVESTTVYGDGRDFTDSFQVSSNGLWVDATCTFATPRRFASNTKFVLKLCGHDLETLLNDTIDFTFVVKFGTNTTISKTFKVTEQAFNFCKEFVIDFAESNSAAIKIAAGDTMQVQLLCADALAQAVLYNGMTVFTALQRRVDADAVASDTKTFAEVVDDVEQLQEDLDDLEEYVDDTFVKKAGDTMSGALNIENIASSNTPLLTLTHSNTATYKWNIAPRYNSTTLSIYPGSTETNGFRFATTGFVPASNNARYLGSASLKWKGVYTGVINNGYDLLVPAKSGTLATKEEVDLAANSGSQLYDTGVWYAKMNSDTVVPTGAEYNDRNYADFSQVDRRSGRPIIVIYSCINGVWDEVETITPPDSYNGYITVTSKIWDIPEQAGQQGGEILWSFERQRFTPYPKIVSFDGQNITNSTFSGGTITNSTFSGSATLSGTSTVDMPQDPTGDQIVNKDYVDNHIPTGNFYHPDLLDWKWADHICNDVQWLRADTFSWQQGSVYKAAYKHLRNDMYNWYSWENNGTTIYTKKAYPEVGEKAYSDSALTTEVGEITAVTDTLDITVEKITVNNVVYDSVSGSNIAPTTETIAGVTVQYIPAEDGHKIVTDFHESEVEAVYAATGVAWYYIIDYGFKRFKLPRSKHRKLVGFNIDYNNGTSISKNTDFTCPSDGLVFISHYGTSSTGTLTVNSSSFSYFQSVGAGSRGCVSLPVSKGTVVKYNLGSGTFYPEIKQEQDTDQYKYLYFYVGEFTQTALENTAGLNAELFNDKVDIGHQVIAFQAPTADNNYTWYRKYADGWVEQGGIYNAPNLTYLITMADTHYVMFLQPMETSGKYAMNCQNLSTTGATIDSSSAQWHDYSWQVSGMAA